MYHCNTCDIAHEERYCPLCEANGKIEELEENIEKLEGEIEELKNVK